MKNLLMEIRENVKRQLEDAACGHRAAPHSVFGKKGELTAVLRGMGKLSAEERPAMGQLANEVREYIEKALAARAQKQKEEALQIRLFEEKLDVTIPGNLPQIGKGTLWPPLKRKSAMYF